MSFIGFPDYCRIFGESEDSCYSNAIRVRITNIQLDTFPWQKTMKE